MNFPEFLILLTENFGKTFQGRQPGSRHAGPETGFRVTKTLPPATQPVASNCPILIFPQPARLYAKSRLESRTYCVAF